MFLIKFLGSTAGRWTRAIAGIALLILGISNNLAWLSIVGLVVAAAGIFDVCLFAPLFKKPFSGKKLRASFK
ncbi:MAG: YgaP-like transmembrane domain [Micrococcales bacterium]